MGLFKSKETKTKVISENEFSWSENKVSITEDGYLLSEGVMNINRIPIRHIETVTYHINMTKDVAATEIQLVGKGVVLGVLKVGNELKDELQDWLLAKLKL
ncbi:non-ribosomal peptide synthetase component E (peptide arylation enzyme) [Bacillus mesophilus]|uniref:Uncharacterized protein n=1 Tax=Bacillus mesophilus TaxID=1808955 RepID=A0A6M0Q8N1_9BACI|nr:hypothetical protein [Bacillus mesophilus]MBM7661100.1 non-ribosomal peptide synthetase component E (peptide arylation enzyme) [Bacillus mesophilus]NEY71368.1 hypothetical protein [Bacillus mesophilus]